MIEVRWNGISLSNVISLAIQKDQSIDFDFSLVGPESTETSAANLDFSPPSLGRAWNSSYHLISLFFFTRSRGSGTSKSSSSDPGSRRGEAKLSFPSNSDRYSNDRDCPNQITRVGLRALSEPEVFILCVRTRGGGRTATGHAKS